MSMFRGFFIHRLATHSGSFLLSCAHGYSILVLNDILPDIHISILFVAPNYNHTVSVDFNKHLDRFELETMCYHVVVQMNL